MADLAALRRGPLDVLHADAGAAAALSVAPPRTKLVLRCGSDGIPAAGRAFGIALPDVCRAATSGTRNAMPAALATKGSPSASGFQKPSVTFPVSTSPGLYSLSFNPSTSRYQATACSTSRVGIETKSTPSTCIRAGDRR